jgi:hypothetical protein
LNAILQVKGLNFRYTQNFPIKLKKYQRLSHVVFYEPRNQGLSIPKDVEVESWATHLAYLSAREPGNLLNHVRRIYLHLELNQSEALYGAMLDLYLILGNNGAELRNRLLRLTKKDLPPGCYELFLACREQGLQRSESYPASQYSVFGNFFQGGLNLVIEEAHAEQQRDKRLDPLELAHEELTFGDISVAQEILEQALLASPHRMGLHFGLLDVYKHTHSLSDLVKMQEQLGDKVSIAQSAWIKTRRFLESQGY